MSCVATIGAIPRNIPFSRVSCDGNELTYVKEVLESGWLTTASKAQEFERRFAQESGRFAIAVNSCTSALHLGLEAMGVGPGDKVLVPTMTFTASAEVIRYLGADPVFLDVEYGSSLITPEIVSEAIDRHPDAKALIVVHFAGQPAPMFRRGDRPGILEVCREGGLKVLEDAAHAFPTRCGNRMVGSLGDATCFSFYANKTITTGEGGMLTTDDDVIAARARSCVSTGSTATSGLASRAVNLGVRRGRSRLQVQHAGYQRRDRSGPVGRADILHDQRQRCAVRYLERLADLQALDLPRIRVPLEDHAWHLFVVIIKPQGGVERGRLIALLSERGIGSSVPYKPLHRMSYYRDRYRLKPEDYPQAERIWRGCLALPLYPTLSDDEIDYICDSLYELLG